MLSGIVKSFLSFFFETGMCVIAPNADIIFNHC